MRSLVVLFALVAAAVAAPSAEKRSIGHVFAYSVPSAVSHQSRVDLLHSPAFVASEPIYAAAPVVTAEHVIAPAVVEARTVYTAPLTTVYSGGSAVTHQSRVDVQSSPAVVTQQVVVPAAFETRSVYAPSAYAPTVYASYL